MTRGGSLTLIGCFALLLGMPGVASLVGVPGPGQTGQPRPRPPLQLPSLLSGRFGTDMSAWIFDAVALKAPLSGLDSRIDVSIFRDSPAPHQVVFGQRGFAFRVDQQDERERVELDPKALVQSVTNLDREATRAGRRLLIAVSPSKASLYPEYLPAPHRRLQARVAGPVETALSTAAASPDSPIVDLWAPLRAEKKRLLAVRKPAHRRLRFVFRPTDDHWSFEAGQVQARSIVTAVDAAAWHDDRVVMTPPYVRRESELSTLFLHTGLKEPYVSAAINPDVVLAEATTTIDGGLDRPHRVTTFHATTTGPMAPASRRLVVVHDACLSSLPTTPGFGHDGGIEAIATSFEHTVFVPWDALTGARAAALVPFFTDADVVIIQVGEARVGDLMTHEATLVTLLQGASPVRTPPREPQPAP